MDTIKAINFISEIKSHRVFINDTKFDELTELVKSMDFKVRALEWYLEEYHKTRVIFEVPENWEPQGKFSIELIGGEK